MENNNTDFRLIKLKDSNKNILYHIPSKKRYLIKNENIDQLYSYMESIRKLDKVDVNKSYIKKLEIMTTTTCNLNCVYCYAKSGCYGKNEEIMTIEMSNKLVKYLEDNKISMSSIETVTFFGGEPFFGYKAIINICELFEKKVDKLPIFKVVTNMTYLPDELINTLVKYKFIITVSLDGPEEINNRLRFSKKEDFNVFQTVKSNIDRLNKRGLNIHAIECTYTKLHEMKGYFKNELECYLRKEFSVEEVIIANNMLESWDEVENIKSDSKIKRELILGLLKPGYCLGGLCLAGLNSITFTPHGDIYPCHLFLYRDEFKMGNVNDNVGNFRPIQNQLKIIRDKLGCNTCEARNICSQCYENLIFNNGALNGRCNIIKDLNKKLIEASITNDTETLYSKLNDF